MNPTTDKFLIWDTAKARGLKKYEAGQMEHGCAFWTAGGDWYLEQCQDEALDLIAYLYHARIRMENIRHVAQAMEAEQISLADAARILGDLCSANPPKRIS